MGIQCVEGLRVTAKKCARGAELCVRGLIFYRSLDYPPAGSGATRKNRADFEVILGIKVCKFLNSLLRFSV